MGYATTILRLRDADLETELALEALDGDSDDGAVLDVGVVIGYGSSTQSQHRGYVRLTMPHLEALYAWLDRHVRRLRDEEYQQAVEDAEDEET